MSTPKKTFKKVPEKKPAGNLAVCPCGVSGTPKTMLKIRTKIRETNEYLISYMCYTCFNSTHKVIPTISESESDKES